MTLRKGLMRTGRSERDERLKLSPQEEDIALELAQRAFETHPSKNRVVTELELHGIIREALKQQHYAGVRAPRDWDPIATSRSSQESLETGTPQSRRSAREEES